MTVEEISFEDKLQLNVKGKVDAISAPDFQNAVLKAFVKSADVIINFGETTYISSAGLRALLIGQKTAQSKGGSFTIINANEGIIDVLRVTGLEKMLRVQ
ncbi:MAG: STAS domain-containing protein [Butyrivibrio sp.]|nr:STAS domain-containing protein [Butyrivibrio sp.]